ncbi:MAG: ATP-dependent Clp protease proteolytic subunit [bacterium]|nr:ATP-dependent Clp protease proteolytic subunit [bacterium]
MSLLSFDDGDKFFDIKTNMLKKRNLLLYGDLDDSDYKDLLEAMLMLNGISEVEPINLFLCSHGGEVDAGMAIYDLIQWLPAPVYTIGMGNCASMAAILLMSGQKRFIFPHCWVMLHQTSGWVWGDKDTTVSRATRMERQEKQMLELQARHTGKTAEEIAKDTIKEKWFDAEEALAYGIVDEIIRLQRQVAPVVAKEGATRLKVVPAIN